ncbi:MAG: YegS/Rv2252/BmrU family lipid kinase [Clostridiales bacterium]|nr:YegS/Rv2252/BmrU family lipid kinase [Clostridiales bacterium]
MKALLLINGSAGTGKMSHSTYHMIEKLSLGGYETTVFPIIPGSGFTAEALLEGKEGLYDMVVCVGGDGTLNHVVDGLMRWEKRPLLGYIPAGSTNDFAKGLSIVGPPHKLIETLTDGAPMAYDIGAFNDRHFSYVAAFGAFVAISYATEQKYKNMLGHAAYVLNGLSRLGENINYSCHMWVSTNEGSEEGDYLFGAVYSTVSIGGIALKGQMRSELSDGMLELLLIRKPNSIIDVEQIAASLLAGNINSPYITFKQIRRAKFVSTEPVNWTLDGEFGGSLSQAEIHVEKQALQIMVPK